MGRIACSLVLGIFGLAACTSGGGDDTAADAAAPPAASGNTKDFVSLDGQKICAAAAACDSSDAGADELGECAAGYNLLVASAECKSQLEGVTCTSSLSTILATCFPPCDATFVPACDGSHLTQCVKGKTSVYDCVDVCAYVGKTFSGACGGADAPKCLCQ